MKKAERNSTIIFLVGIFFLLLAIGTRLPKIFISAVILFCTSYIIDSLVSIFSEKESKDAKEN